MFGVFWAPMATPEICLSGNSQAVYPSGACPHCCSAQDWEDGYGGVPPAELDVQQHQLVLWIFGLRLNGSSAKGAGKDSSFREVVGTDPSESSQMLLSRSELLLKRKSNELSLCLVSLIWSGTMVLFLHNPHRDSNQHARPD